MSVSKIHSRSRSVSTSREHGSKRDYSTMLDEINSLKSFQSAWENIPTKKNSDSKTRAKFSPIDDLFIFPFFHLDSSCFEVNKSRCTVYDNSTQIRRAVFSASLWESSLYFPLNRLMQMTGLDNVKREFLSVRDHIKVANYCKGETSIRRLNLDLIITGHPGTGKSTVARLYAEYLGFLGVVSSCRWARSDESYYSSNPYTSSYDEVADDEIIIMDEYVDTDVLNSNQGVFIIVGHRELAKDILSHPKARGRFSRWIDIEDYSNDDLFTILVEILERDSLRVEGGFDAPFLRTFTRLIGYQRGQKKFEYIKTLQTEVKKACRRRADRLGKVILEGNGKVTGIPYLFYNLTESDFFGVQPTDFYKTNESWKKLDSMAGLEAVKEAVKGLVCRRVLNYARGIQGKEPFKTSCNYVFLGPPGTGKTTVAKLFGQIIADLGYIENKDVTVKTPADFLGCWVGHSEDRTREILEETEGQVLIIDEAHMFYQGSEHGTDHSDTFRKGIVDTLVAHVDNEPGNGRCIILMGYPDRMKELYRNTNPGFQRRFPLEDAFIFENYDDLALSQIFDIMLANNDIAVTANAKIIAMEVLRRERDRPNFGNGGAVRNLISRAQVSYGNRMRSLANENKNSDVGASLGSEETHQVVLEPQDFDPEYERGLLNKDFGFLLNTLVGFENIINFFESYQRMAINMRRHGFDPREEIPFSFVFKGPPGTGKTTIARGLGNIYHSMGFLSTNEVLECSVTDLIGPGPCLIGKNVQNMLDRALGKVLFIDEAYRLGQTDMTGAVMSNFAIEALGELVDCMTKRRYAHKLVVVLAGYENDMNDLMEMNKGLRSCFTEVLFLGINPKECLNLLQMKLMEKNIRILQPKKGCEQQKAIRLFKKLSKTEAWANARDVETITKRVIRRVFSEEIPVGEELKISLEEIVAILKAFLQERNYKGHVDTSSDEEIAVVEAF